jgi:hypothetical protein
VRSKTLSCWPQLSAPKTLLLTLVVLLVTSCDRGGRQFGQSRLALRTGSGLRPVEQTCKAGQETRPSPPAYTCGEPTAPIPKRPCSISLTISPRTKGE